jgi:CspA family cold shock protein
MKSMFQSTVKLAGFYRVKRARNPKTPELPGENGALPLRNVDNCGSAWGKRRGFLEALHWPWYGLAYALYSPAAPGDAFRAGLARRSFFLSCRLGNRRSLGVHSRLERSGCMATGKVKWFNDQKGFGFIASDNNGKDIFVHHTVIEAEGFRTLQDGETVEYEAEDGPKGMKATKVRRVMAVAPAPAS